MADGTRKAGDEPPPYDLILRGGRVFDGRGGSRIADVAVRDDVVEHIGAVQGTAREEMDCAGLWVTPGFIDLHTHYDAEIEVAPGLSESVRHGVTTVVLGSCSLSLALGAPDDLADMFCRVEGIPDAVVRRMLRERKNWDGHREYLQHLDSLALGPNVASFAGHSALRTHLLGMDRATTRGARMTKQQHQQQRALLEDALDAGYLGLSVQTLPWDKLGGSRDWRSRPLPSTYAPWSEVRGLARTLREHGAVLQGVPNVSTKWNVILFLLESMGLFRAPLKTTVVSMMDIAAAPGIHRLIGKLSSFFNSVLDADFRWQALPEIFDLYAEGMDMVVFEEFEAGASFLHHESVDERRALLADRSWRTRFRRQWRSKLAPRAFHRRLSRASVVDAPDASLVGKTFTQIANERGADAVETFLDLVAEHGRALRWYTVMANEREESIGEIASHPDVLIGFSDAGAHLRNMAHYNFPLRLLRHARRLGFMTPERAVQRCTGEIAEWLGLDAGVLEAGRRADITVLRPDGIDDGVEEMHEAEIPELDGFKRLVRRNDRAVAAVFVGGKQAVRQGVPTANLGKERFGRILRRLGCRAQNDELRRTDALPWA